MSQDLPGGGYCTVYCGWMVVVVVVVGQATDDRAGGEWEGLRRAAGRGGIDSADK